MTETPVGAAPAPEFPLRTNGATWGGAVRTGSGVVLGALVGGVVMGVVWAWITPSLWLVVRSDGAYPETSAQDRWFSADGWFLVLGLALGVVLALGASWRGRQHPVGALFGLFLGGLLAAVAAWWIGGLLGPPDPTQLLAAAPPGARFEQSLGLRAMAVLLAPAIAGLATFVAAFAAAPPRGSGETLP